jgi:hypothetical protein
VAFYSPGAFAGAPSGGRVLGYLARRGPLGWFTTAMMSPAALGPDVGDQDVSSTLSSTVVLAKRGSGSEAASVVGPEEIFAWHENTLADIEANWEVSPIVVHPPGTAQELGEWFATYAGANADLCHVFFDKAPRPLLPAAEETDPEIRVSASLVYEIDRGCNGESPSLRLMDLNNVGGPISRNCRPEIGANEYGIKEGGTRASEFDAISTGGREVFFTENVVKGAHCSGISSGVHQLFVRLDGAKTLEVSKPVAEAAGCRETIPCPGAETRPSAAFVGASEDGSRAYYTTRRSLVGGGGEVTDLEMAEIGCAAGTGEACIPSETTKMEVKSLTQVSPDRTGEQAEVQGVVRVASDGSRVYYVARGVLTSEGGPEGRAAVAGADNLYVYNSLSGVTEFIATLCSGPESSGTVEDPRCPNKTGNDTSLWGRTQGEAHTAGADGGFLVFSSYGQLVANDTDAAKDVYRYDAETGELERVSIGEDDYDSNGNNSLFDASITEGEWGGTVVQQSEMRTRAISEDGSRIVFASAEPLSPSAINGLTNVYEWHQASGESEGRVSLISSGNAQEAVTQAMITPAGEDVFFQTAQSLVAQDVDVLPDIYDARVGAGFASASAPRQACSGDACQGPLTNPAPLLVAGSVAQAPGENIATPSVKAEPKAKPKANSKKKRKKRRQSSKRRGRAGKVHGRSKS